MEKEKSQRIWGAQHGQYIAENNGWTPGQNKFMRCSTTFRQSYPETPKLLFGLSRVDAEGSLSRSLSLSQPEVNAAASTFRLHHSTIVTDTHWDAAG